MKDLIPKKVKAPKRKKFFSFSEKTMKILGQTKNISLSIGALLSTFAGVAAIFFPPAAIALGAIAILAYGIGFTSSFLESKSNLKPTEENAKNLEQEKDEPEKSKEKEQEKSIEPPTSFKDKIAKKIANSKIFKKMFKKPLNVKRIKTIENIAYGLGTVLTILAGISAIFFPPALLGIGVVCGIAYGVSSLASIASAVAENHLPNQKENISSPNEKSDEKTVPKAEKALDKIMDKKDQFLAKLYKPAIFNKIPKKYQDPKEMQRISDLSGFVGAGLTAAAAICAVAFPPLVIPLFVFAGLAYGLSVLSFGASKILEAHSKQELLKESSSEGKSKQLEKDTVTLLKKDKIILKTDSEIKPEKIEPRQRSNTNFHIPPADSTPSVTQRRASLGSNSQKGQNSK